MAQPAVPDIHELSAICFEHVLRVCLSQPVVMNNLRIGSARQDSASRVQITVAFEGASDDRYDPASAMTEAADFDRIANLRADFERQVQFGSGGPTAVYRWKHSRSRL